MTLDQFVLSIPILICYLFVTIFNRLKFNGLKRFFKNLGEKLTNIAFKETFKK